MKISYRKNETVLRIGPGESALYYGTYAGKQCVGCVTASNDPDIATIDAALRGFAAMITHDPEFLKMMVDIYHDTVLVRGGDDDSVRH